MSTESSVAVIDNYNLALSAIITFGIQGTAFLISYFAQTDKLTDITGAVNFALLAIITLGLGGGGGYGRPTVVSVMVILWSIRLGGFLLFRVLKTGKDGRFDEMRASFVKFGGFWLFQFFWVFTVSLPVIIINSPLVAISGSASYGVRFGKATDIIGIIFWAIGFAIEIVGDAQKYKFKSNQPPKGAIMNKGVWNWTRHPNFFGEILLWWGVWVIAVTPALHYSGGGSQESISQGAKAALKASVIGPIFITLLLFFVSGLPPAEKPTAKRYFLLSHGSDSAEGDPWADYKRYLTSTSIFWPIPPALYRPIPQSLKQTLFLDFKMYHFNEEKDGREAIEEEEKKRRQERH